MSSVVVCKLLVIKEFLGWSVLLLLWC